MILAPAVPYVPLTPLIALEPGCLPLGSTRQRAQWAQPPQATWLEPERYSMMPGEKKSRTSMGSRSSDARSLR